MGNNKIWDLSIKKVNNSLTEVEKQEFEAIEKTQVAKKLITQAELIRKRSSENFYYQLIDKEANWHYINSQTRFNSRSRKLLLNLMKYAAVFIFALLLAWGIPKLFHPNISGLANNKIEMEWGQMSKLTLCDGTEVWLNAGTKFEYPTSFDGKERTVSLVGEAQFKVTHSDKVPFMVKTNSGTVKVFGTTFNVSAYDEDRDFAVTLIEGKVTVENNDGKYLAELKPSDQLLLNKLTGKAILKQVNTDFYNSWIEGKILLNDTKLSDITTLLQRWYNVDIKLMDKELGDLQISGAISKGKPLDLFLTIIERMYGVRYELISNDNKKDEIKIYKN